MAGDDADPAEEGRPGERSGSKPRLTFLRRAPLVLVGARTIAPIACARGDELPAARQSNIILIIADDAGAGDRGTCGHPRKRTPHPSELARTGVRFSACDAMENDRRPC